MKFLDLLTAQKIARKVMAELSPWAERIEVAGSVRRMRAVVRDLDFVILPKPGAIPEIQSRCRRACLPLQEGPQNSIYKMHGTEAQIDLFFARPPEVDLLEKKPGNFGTIFLIRTGSREHNIFLIERAKMLQKILRPTEGVFSNENTWLAGESEEEIFAALDLPFLSPEKRER